MALGLIAQLAHPAVHSADSQTLQKVLGPVLLTASLPLTPAEPGTKMGLQEEQGQLPPSNRQPTHSDSL